MDRFNALGRGMQIMLVAGVLLLIDTFLPWQKVTVTILGVEASSSANAWHGFWGVVMGLLVIVMVAWLIARLAAVDIPLPVSSAMVSATIAVIIFLFALIKNLADDYSTFWSYLGVILAALVAVGAWLQVQESGGIETLKTEATSMGGSGGSAAATTTAETPPPAPAPTAPTPPAAAEPAAAPTPPPTPPSPAPAEPSPPASAPPVDEPDEESPPPGGLSA
jgi:hypothetical protein